MRCKRHASDTSSTVGVCATCLRERLLSIIAAQSNRGRSQVSVKSLAAASSVDHNPQKQLPILFPRSVSPNVPRGRKVYEDEEAVTDGRFYSTPQIGQRTRRKKHGGRFSFFSSLFKRRSEKSDFELKLPGDSHETTSSATTTSSSWLSSIRRMRTSKPPTTTGERLPRRVVVVEDRGMTPERMSCAEGSEFDEPRVEYFSDSCKRTPARSAKPSSTISGMAFCMSPLVRASPARLWNQKSVPPDIVGFSGDIRSVGNPHLSFASSYCANRSRKLADFGRVGHYH